MDNTKNVAEFIRTMTIELTDMARGADLPALGFILTLASLEAKRSLKRPRDRARRKPRNRGNAGVGSAASRRASEPRVAAR